MPALAFVRRRWLLILASGLLLVLVLYGAVSWFFSDRLIGQKFPPLGPTDVTAFGLPQPEDARIPGDGVTLAAWYFENPQDRDCAVILLHGFGGNRAEVLGPSPIFWDRGCDLLLYDARGHGDSSPALLS